MTDLIEKEKAIEALYRAEALTKAFGYHNVIDTIREMPTVEAEPVRHAHWIWKGDEGDSRFMCSECRCMENVPTCMGVPNIWEYCPNCGARMEEYELERKRTETGGTDPAIWTGNS